MNRVFTAQQMRDMASVVLEDVYGNDVGGASYDLSSKFDENIIADMLRQSADLMEREEKRERKYEYAEMYSNGDVGYEKGDSINDVNHFLSDGSIIVRREVGDWEEVEDGK